MSAKIGYFGLNGMKLSNDYRTDQGLVVESSPKLENMSLSV